jgi:hypothetical protein
MFTGMKCVAAVALVCVFVGVAAGEGLVAWFDFEGDAQDASGHGHVGTVSGTVTYGAGSNGQAIEFDVSTEGVTLTGFPLVQGAFTVSCWVKFGSDQSSWLVSQMQGPTGGLYYGWNLKTTLKADQYVPVLQLGNGTNVRVDLWDTTYSTLWNMYDEANPTVWHHIAATHDGVNTARVYLNGNLYAESTSMPYAAATTPVTYIRRPSFSGGNNSFDDVLILNRAMDAGEIAGLYNDGVSLVSWPLAVSPGSVQELIALQDSPAPGPVAYKVYNDDGVASHTTDIAEVDANGNSTDYGWLSLSTTQVAGLAASSHATVNAVLDHSALAPGNYTAYLRFGDDSVPAKVLTRQIQLTVLGCQWAVTPGSVKRYYLSGSGDPVAPVTYTVSNTGKHGLTYTVQEVVDQPWLTLSKGSGGPLNYQATDTVTATVNPAGLAVGQYICTIRFTNNCSPADSVDYTVTLNVENNIVGDGLQAYYRFEDTARDWTGNGWNGVVGGAPSYREGNYGRAIEFHGVGSGDQVDLGDVPCPNPAVSQEMTVALWFRADTLAIEASWLINKITSAGSSGWEGWQIKNSSQWFGLAWQVSTINFRWCHDGLRDSLNTSGPNMDIEIPTLYDGNWHQIVMTIEDADGPGGNLVNVRGYYDGALIEGQNIWNQQPEIVKFERLGTTFVPAPVTTNVWVSGDVDRVLGGVDELSLWDRALSPAEIAYMYQTGGVPQPLPPWPDADEDGDVDQVDFASVQECFSGSGVAASEACQRFNRDTDEDVDETDLDEFENCATGPGIPLDQGNPPSGCAL